MQATWDSSQSSAAKLLKNTNATLETQAFTHAAFTEINQEFQERLFINLVGVTSMQGDMLIFSFISKIWDQDTQMLSFKEYFKDKRSDKVPAQRN